MSDGGYTGVFTQLSLHRETLRRWALEAEGKDPYQPGRALLPKDEKGRAALEQENKELRRANDPQDGRAFLRAELDRRPKK